MNQPALLVQHGKTRLMIDGGGARPKHRIVAWLVTDQQGELIREISKLARPMDLEPTVSSFSLCHNQTRHFKAKGSPARAIAVLVTFSSVGLLILRTNK